MNEELKPCPWCGDTECNPASMEMGKDAGKYSYMAEVQCGCGGIGPEAYGECASDAEANAVKTWNARLTPAVKDSLTAAAAAGVQMDDLLGAIGRGWCSPENANKEMDSTLAIAIAKEVAALTAELAEARERVAKAYGLLWHVNAGIDAPCSTPSLTPERAAMESRKVLRDMLTSEQRGDGINAARDFMKALAPDQEKDDE